MSEFWMNFWMSVVAGVISGLISGVIVSEVFYRRSILDQKRDMALLMNLHRITIQALENAKYIEVNRDSHGNPTGIAFLLQAGTGVFSATGRPSEMAVKQHVVAHPPVPPAENPG